MSHFVFCMMLFKTYTLIQALLRGGATGQKPTYMFLHYFLHAFIYWKSALSNPLFEAGEIAQQLRALSALVGNQSLVIGPTW